MVDMERCQPVVSVYISSMTVVSRIMVLPKMFTSLSPELGKILCYKAIKIANQPIFK